MFDPLLESSFRDDSNMWSNIGFDEDIMQVVSIKVNFSHLIWRSGIDLYHIAMQIFLCNKLNCAIYTVQYISIQALPCIYFRMTSLSPVENNYSFDTYMLKYLNIRVN